MGNNDDTAFVSISEVVVTNNDQARAFAQEWCIEGGYPKASISFVSLVGNDRIFSIRVPDLEMVLEVQVDIFGDVHLRNK